MQSQRSFLCRTDEQLLLQRDTPTSFHFVNKRKRWGTYIFSDNFGSRLLAFLINSNYGLYSEGNYTGPGRSIQGIQIQASKSKPKKKENDHKKSSSESIETFFSGMKASLSSLEPSTGRRAEMGMGKVKLKINLVKEKTVNYFQI
jgi:hypothetical protein